MNIVFRTGALFNIGTGHVMLNLLFLGKGLGSKVIKLGVERFIMEKSLICK
tara:strand:+ start:308 stop:460 length:153 start_codon:yes stop_codon:yes gene_type:complete